MASSEGNGNNGMFAVPIGDRVATVIASDGLGWEHVSVSFLDRCPTWEEMCLIKNIFWGDDDLVVQFHPRKSEYVNVHPHCLHLWRRIGSEFDSPPKYLVG